MTSIPTASGGRVERGVAVGRRLVDVGIAVPAPGESLSAAARRLAERVVVERMGLRPGSARVASLLPSGRPVVSAESGILPLGVSVAHERGLVAAAICEDSGVGIDVVDPSVVRAGLDQWLAEGERRAGSPGMIWAAKEAAYKAAGLDAVFRPLAVEIEPDADGGFTWTLRDEWRSAGGTGRFLEAGRHLVAVACAETAPTGPDEAAPEREVVACS